MQALSRTKGRLTMDVRAQDHHDDIASNPYLGLHLVTKKAPPRPTEIEPIRRQTEYRPLKLSEREKRENSRREQTTMAMIQESKDRIKEKREKKEKGPDPVAYHRIFE